MTKLEFEHCIKMRLSDYKMQVVIKYYEPSDNEERTTTSEYFIQSDDEELDNFSYISDLPIYALTEEQLNQIYYNVDNEKFTLMLELKMDLFEQNAYVERWNIISL